MPDTTQTRPRMRLYSTDAERLYLNGAELDRFLKAANLATPDARRFALTLAYTGARISEALALRYADFQLDARVVSIHCLKKRRLGEVRELPLPKPLVAAFKEVAQPGHALVWSRRGAPIPRRTAYRWIKTIMAEAGITGPRACPKGLRHAYGTRAMMKGVPLHILQRWMGHSDMETTAIYATVLGPDQIAFVDQMWRA